MLQDGLSLRRGARPSVHLALEQGHVLLTVTASHNQSPHLLLRHEVQRGRVDAVSEAGGLGAVLEDVPEVAAALLARHLGADQPGVGDYAKQVPSH